MRVFFITLLLMLTLNSCSTEPTEERYSSYIIKIDSITLPDTISVSDTLIIKFDGTVGTDGCHRFKTFEVVDSNSILDLTVWGEKPNYETACPAVMVYLNGKEYKMKPDRTGEYIIHVNQPDGSVLKDSVFVQ